MSAKARQHTDWTEIGSLLDSLNDVDVKAEAPSPASPHYRLEFAVRTPEGELRPIRTITSRRPAMRLFFDADTRYAQRVRLPVEIVRQLIAYIKQHPVHGRAPRRTLISTGDYHAYDTEGPEYAAAARELYRLLGETMRD